MIHQYIFSLSIRLVIHFRVGITFFSTQQNNIKEQSWANTSIIHEHGNGEALWQNLSINILLDLCLFSNKLEICFNKPTLVYSIKYNVWIQ